MTAPTRETHETGSFWLRNGTGEMWQLWWHHARIRLRHVPYNEFIDVTPAEFGSQFKPWPLPPSSPVADPRERMETWFRQLEEWAVVERGGEDVCRWCAVNRGFHHSECPIRALVEGVRTYVGALRRSGVVEVPPMLSAPSEDR